MEEISFAELTVWDILSSRSWSNDTSSLSKERLKHHPVGMDPTRYAPRKIRKVFK